MENATPRKKFLTPSWELWKHKKRFHPIPKARNHALTFFVKGNFKVSFSMTRFIRYIYSSIPATRYMMISKKQMAREREKKKRVLSNGEIERINRNAQWLVIHSSAAFEIDTFLLGEASSSLRHFFCCFDHGQKRVAFRHRKRFYIF